MEEKYGEDMNNLRRENTELRRKVIEKSEEFWHYKFQMERANEKVNYVAINLKIANEYCDQEYKIN